jgi:hypothetical protein
VILVPQPSLPNTINADEDEQAGASKTRLSLGEEGDEHEPVRKHSGNVQGTFREHSGNIQGTFREHSGNIPNVQGSFRAHSGHVPWRLSFGDPVIG